MQVSASTSVSSATSTSGAGGSGAQIAKLQKQLKETYKDLQAVTTDGSLDAKAREVKQKLLQAQIAAIQQQIVALQQAEAQRVQAKAAAAASRPDEKTRETERKATTQAIGKTAAKDVSGRLGTQVDTYA